MSVGLIPPPNPSYTPGEQLLGVYSASAGASIDIVNRNQGGLSGPIFQSDFDVYVVKIVNILIGTNAQGLKLLFSTNGGVSYDTAANYNWQSLNWHGTGATATAGGDGASALISVDGGFGANGISNTATNPLTGELEISNPLSTTLFKDIRGRVRFKESNGGVPLNNLVSASYLVFGTAVNACQFIPTAGTITGVILVYGKAKSAIAGSTILTGMVVNEANFETGAMATGTTIVPWDNTIPQNTEGDQYMQLVYTPRNAANRLRIDALGYFNNSSGVVQIMSLFQDAIANALASQAQYNAVVNGLVQVNLTHHMIAGTISPITFKIRCGGHVAGTTTFNGQTGAPFLGGVLASGITITEFLV